MTNPSARQGRLTTTNKTKIFYEANIWPWFPPPKKGLEAKTDGRIDWLSVSSNVTLPLFTTPFNREDGVRTVLRNVDIRLPHYTAQKPRKPLILKIYCSPLRPDRLWGPATLLCSWYWELFSGNKVVEDCSQPLSSIKCLPVLRWFGALLPLPV
jgi:hypothetical protein